MIYCHFYWMVGLLVSRWHVNYMIQVCPNGPLWNKRADEMKCNGNRSYHCLLDTNANNTSNGFYVEKCLSPKKYIDKRYVFSGNLNALNCKETQYTPQPIWSNNTRNSECPFHKSLCEEEGQVIADNGTTRTDSACRCNYIEGYNYVKMPKDPCKCFPNKEDCSCYFHQCFGSTKVLSQDYKCELVKNFSKIFSCGILPFKPPQMSGNPTFSELTASELLPNHDDLSSAQIKRTVILTVLVIICLSVTLQVIIFTGKFLIQSCKRRRRKPVPFMCLEYFGNFKINSPGRIFRGDDVCLECNTLYISDISEVTWSFTKMDTSEKIKIDLEISDKYLNGTTTSPSLLIKNVDKTDSGTYECIIELDDKTHLTRTTKLNIPELIFIQELPVVNHFQSPQQLSAIENAFLGKNRKKLVVLEGVKGAGKSQAAHYYCMKMKHKYSIVGKILLNTVLSLKEELESFATDLKFKISYDRAVDTNTIVDNIKDCLNQEERKGFPYLLFIDDVDQETIKSDYSEIVSLVSLMKTVPNLDMILATTDLKMKDNLEGYELITFEGMNDDELNKVLKDVEEQEEDVICLKKVIGNIPIVVVTAIRFMMQFELSAKKFLEEFSSTSCNISAQPYYNTIEGLDKTEYDKTALKSQILPLNFIKNTLSKEQWSVVTLIPYFRHDNISMTLLEAVYFHLKRCQSDQRNQCSNGNQKKNDLSTLGIHSLVESLVNIPLCQLRHLKPARIQTSSASNSEKNENQNTVLSFHNVTRDAVSILANQHLEMYESKHLSFLLKMFCFEIDIDAASDATVERNLRFVQHAIKLLKIVDDIQNEFSDEESQFCIAFLHCAIGTTFFFERTKVEKAHFHLMKARDTALGIVKSECELTKKNCIYINDEKTVLLDEKSDAGHTKLVMRCIVEKTFSKEFCEEFILGKYRNISDIDAMRKELIVDKLEVFDSHYITKTDYDYLVQNNLAMPLINISKLFLPELFLRILHNNGVTLNELQYVTNYRRDSKQHTMLKSACNREYETAVILRKTIEEYFPTEHVKLFVCLRNKRSGLDITSSTVQSEDLKENMLFCAQLLESPQSIFYEFGIIKFAGKSNIRHISHCNSVLLRLLMQKYKEEHNVDKKQEMFNRGKTVMENLRQKIEEIETTDAGYTWMSLSFLYIVCGRFLLLSGISCDIERALLYFKRSLEIEESRSVVWTRYIHEAFTEKIECLQKLKREEEAFQAIDLAINKLKRQNRKEVINKYAYLRKKIRYKVNVNLDVSVE